MNCPLCNSSNFDAYTAVGEAWVECGNCYASAQIPKAALLEAASRLPEFTGAKNHPTQEQFTAALADKGFVGVRPVPCICEGFNGFHTVRCAEACRTRSEPPAERRDADESQLGVPRG